MYIPTFGSLFAGVGGIDLGLERAGMACKWQVEIDPFCNKVLAKHWPNVKRYGDARDCGSHNLESVDLICGGFPCQPHSVAGKQKGAEDDRNLWPEFLRIVKELRPSWVLAENVPGIVSLYLDTVLADLEGEGYTCWTFDIPACAFDAPHIRRRIFVVAHTNSPEPWDEPRRRGRPHREDTPQPSNDGAEAFMADAESQRKTATQQPGPGHGPIASRQDVAHPDYSRQLQPQGVECSQRGRAGNSGEAISNTNGKGLEGRRLSRPTGDGSQNMENSQRDDSGPKVVGRKAGGKNSTRSAGGIGRSSWWAVEPDVGRVADGVPNRVDRLRALGNAVVPQVAEWIGRQILQSLPLVVDTEPTTVGGDGTDV